MLRTVGMKKLMIVGHDASMRKVIETLYNLGVMHIKEHKSVEGLDIGEPLPNSSSLSESIVDIRAIADYLKLDLNKSSKLSKIDYTLDIQEIQQEVSLIKEKTKNILEEISQLDETIKQREYVLNEIEPLCRLNASFAIFHEYNTIVHFAGTLTKPGKFIDELRHITTKYHLVHQEHQGRIYFALFVPKEYNDAISSLLQRHGFSAIDTSKYINQKGTFDEFANTYLKEINLLNKKKTALLNESESIKSRWGNYLLSAERILSEEIEKAESPLKFAKTEHSFIITGWIPEKNIGKAQEMLMSATKEKIYIKILHDDLDEHAPIMFNNAKAVKPFEFFMNIYSLPSYHEIEPTLFIFLSFPIFFGFMLGDIGYGLTTLLLFLFLKRKMPKFSGFFNILIFSSITTILFGVVFGEIYGAENILGFELPRLLSRNPTHNRQPLMISAIFWGILHVNLGLVIGFINELGEHGIWKAIFAKGSWFVLEVGAVFLGLSIAKIGNIPLLAGLIVILLSIIGLIIGEGLKGIFEIPSLFGNILSYLRLMAIGLSSVGLAIVINDLAGAFFKPITVFSIFGVLILVIGHIINIGLGLLGGFLHSMRLHYVEFFTKFYKGGGIPYNPFKRRVYN